ncbi:hypothetical protein INT46_002908 [Mucor plumbeus]|uniref:Uncharacterized protein n=1 Tax=Mucor plumbeus TaxID=97098 RepID=A0A8H7R9Z1_9FUNG|nr:hypothetical protein INT46_002908 [Mucor plumbeus]
MDYISRIPPSDYYIIDDESEEQTKDVVYQYEQYQEEPT